MTEPARPALRVTVAMPIYNGARWMAEALDCWLAQDFRDFELAVSDNASSDDTPHLLAKYAARDPRIRIARRSETVSAVDNYNGLARAARTALFVFAACDDLWEPSYLRRMVEALDASPDASVAYCPPRYFGERPALRTHHPIESGDPAGSRGTPLGRAIAVLRVSNWLPMYGLIRTEALQRSRLFQWPMGIAHDVGFVMELAALGRLVYVPEMLMATRVHGAAESMVQVPRRFDDATRRFIEGMPLSHAEIRILLRETKIYCRKGHKPRHGVWRWHGFRSTWVRAGRFLVDAERRLRGTG